MAHRNEKPSWEVEYQDHWQLRWPVLKEALQNPTGYVAHANPWCDPDLVEEQFAAFQPLPDFSLQLFPIEIIQEPPKDQLGLRAYYPLDLASVFPPTVLGVQEGDQVMDLCAAPGGKALFLINSAGLKGRVVLNEPSRGRRSRLKQVLREYLPPEVLVRVELTGQEGALMGKRFPKTFDKILVDAPCSGERHLLTHDKEARSWTPARTKNLAQRQYAILRGAWAALKPGGALVYSTCSLSPRENDGVVQRLLSKVGELARLEPLDLSLGEPTKLGWHILPDRNPPWGPIYMAKIFKRPAL